MQDAYFHTSRALAVEDIVGAIVQSMPFDPPPVDAYDPIDPNLHLPSSPELIALALTNRMFSEHALDRLWDKTSFWRLARLMPRHFWCLRLADKQNYHVLASPDEEARVRELVSEPDVQSATVQFHMSGVCTTRDLLESRFFHYARRVKDLCLPRIEPSLGCTGLVDTEVLELWQNSQRVLLPRLQGLFVFGGTQQGPELHAPFGFLQSVRHLYLSTSAYAMRPDAGACPPHLALERLICKSELCDDRREWMPFVSEIIRASPNLHTVHADEFLTPEMLRHLARSPVLRELCVGGMLDVHPGDRLPASAFPALETVTLNDFDNDAPLLDMFLTRAAGHRLSDITVTAQSYSRMLFARYLALTGHLARFRTLVRLSIHVWVTSPQPQDGLDDDAEDARTRQFCLDLLAPLTQLGALEALNVSVDWYWMFEEHALVRTIAHWPRLRALRIAQSYSDWNPHTFVFTYRLPAIFELFTHCPELVEYEFAVDASELPNTVPTGCHKFPGPLAVTEFGDLDRLAELVRECLPCVTVVDAFWCGLMNSEPNRTAAAKEMSRLLRQNVT